MDRRELEDKIQSALKGQRGKIVGHHTILALFGALSDPLGVLGKLFFGTKDAIDQGQHRIEQGLILDLLCEIDDLLLEVAQKAEAQLPKDKIIVLGEIVARGRGVRDITGVSISLESGPVEFMPGTKIIATGENANNVIALKIGSKQKED